MSFQMITNLIAWTIGAISEAHKQLAFYRDKYKVTKEENNRG